MLFSAFLLTMGATWLVTFPLRYALRQAGVVDRPNARSSHTLPTVRGGGIGMTLAVCVVLVWIGRAENWVWGFLLAPTVLLAAVSFWDDLRSLGAKVRFAVHALAAGLALYGLLGHAPAGPQAGGIAAAAGVLVLFGWLAGYTNAFNFMDGINGLGGGQALLTGLGTAAVALLAGLPREHHGVILAVAIAGAAAGFLPHNFPRAKVFMGDVASASLGFSLALAGVWIARDAGWPILLWIGLLHANFVLDTGITLIRRIARGERWQEAHREHFYQRLVRAGRSHTEVTLTEGALQIVTVGLVLTGVYFRTQPLWGVLIALLVIALWSGFFVYCERVFRSASAAPAQKP